MEEYLGQPQLYSNFNVTLEELNLYINLKEYSLNTVDSILPMLCNVFNHGAYVFSEINSHAVGAVSTQIQLIYPAIYLNTDKFVFLLKSGDHYELIFFKD